MKKNNLRINSLIVFALSSGLAALATGSIAKADLKSAEDRVSELEANQSLNFMRMSGSLVNRHDMVGFKSNSILGAPAADNQNVNYDRLRLDLNVDADISDSLKFYATTVASKTWNNIYTQNDAAYSGDTTARDLGGAASYRDSGLVIAKAYLDYSMKSLPLVFSAGRLPTYDGPPTHITTGRARMGTYPRLAYNATLDGAALTYKFDSLLGNRQSLALRYIYSPLNSVNHGAPNSNPTVQPTVNLGTEKSATQSPIFAYMLDYNAKSSFWREFNFIAQYIDARPIREADATATDCSTGICGTALLRSTASLSTTRLSLYAGFEDLLQTGLDFNVSYLMTHTDTSGQYYNMALGGAPIGGYYLAAGKDSAQLNGSILLVSARYRLPVGMLRRPWIGAEYEAGSPESMPIDFMPEDITGFYTNRGTGYHAYYIQPLDDNLSLRVGYMFQNVTKIPNHITGPLGALEDCDRNYTTAYASLRLDL